MNILKTLRFQTGHFKVEYKYYECNTCNGRPCHLMGSVARLGSSNCEYAFLQVYEEEFNNGLVNGPYVDLDNCNSHVVPFYSSSVFSPWVGKFTDAPFDSHECDWKIAMYTLFCEVDVQGQKDSPLAWKYLKTKGVKWGFKKSLPGHLTCLELGCMSRSDIDIKFKTVTDKFPGLKLTW